ncbi:MAG TPA: hypothetical protein VGS21_04790 [Acidimicrobiales bacterium]|nr:hypothetical protein [Acidimicrobiales bacterium]
MLRVRRNSSTSDVDGLIAGSLDSSAAGVAPGADAVAVDFSSLDDLIAGALPDMPAYSGVDLVDWSTNGWDDQPSDATQGYEQLYEPVYEQAAEPAYEQSYAPAPQTATAADPYANYYFPSHTAEVEVVEESYEEIEGEDVTSYAIPRDPDLFLGARHQKHWAVKYAAGIGHHKPRVIGRAS